jgi:hypothetical protein
MESAAELAQSGTLVLKRSDVESFAGKLTKFSEQLTAIDRQIFGWLMERAGQAPPLPPQYFHYHPRGAQHLVMGGADGLLVTISRSGIHIRPPEGPVDPGFVGTGFIPPER